MINHQEQQSADFQDAQSRCIECGRVLSESEALIFESQSICSACKPIFIQKLKEGLFNEKSDFNLENVKYAGFWIRAVAKIIDILFLFITMLSTLLILFYRRSHLPLSDTWLWITLFVSYHVYGVLFIGSCGATLGKIIFRIKVISADGKRVVYSAALKRQMAEIFSAAVFLLGYIVVVFDEQKRALHDYYGNSLVIKR